MAGSKVHPEYGHLSSGQMREIRSSEKPIRALAIKYGVSEATIRKVINRGN